MCSTVLEDLLVREILADAEALRDRYHLDPWIAFCFCEPGQLNLKDRVHSSVGPSSCNRRDSVLGSLEALEEVREAVLARLSM